VFVQQPDGFMSEGTEHKVLRLKKAMYGLHLVPMACNAKLDVTLTTLGFMRSSFEPAIYVRCWGSIAKGYRAPMREEKKT
jgi:hypothetical protein